MQTYSDNREYYAQKVQDLNRGRQKAQEARGEEPKAVAQPATEKPATQPSPEPAKRQEEAQEPEVVVTAAGGTTTVKAVPIPEKKKEDSNWLLWGVLGIAGIMVGVNLFRNRN